jgi:23S rRNA pseudouridine2605 synthase/16S rRNA pseudouridine516 synthase
VYYLLNKPKGVLCTQSDPARRTRAVDLLPGVRERVYPVGRLDVDSQGLLLMTNDGELAARLTHPRYGVPKTYRARVSGRISRELTAKLREGVWLSGGKTQPARVSLVYESKEHSILEMTLHEGRNRQVRRMLARLGHPVRELTRIRMGRLELKGLGPGQFRLLRPAEVAELRSLAGKSAERPSSVPQAERNARPAKRMRASQTRSGLGPSESDEGRADFRPGRA